MFIVDKICLATHDLGSKGIIYMITYKKVIYSVYLIWTQYIRYICIGLHMNYLLNYKK